MKKNKNEERIFTKVMFVFIKERYLKMVFTLCKVCC